MKVSFDIKETAKEMPIPNTVVLVYFKGSLVEAYCISDNSWIAANEPFWGNPKSNQEIKYWLKSITIEE